VLRSRVRTAAAVALALAVASCAAGDGAQPVGSSISPITQGTPTSGDLGVVALLESGTLVCTATLVAPRVLLTAAHCLPDGALPAAYFGESPQSGAATVALLAAVRHPGFDPTTLTNDLAMALLAEASPAGATPWPLPSAPLGPGSIGIPLRLVGFGRTGPDDTTPAQKRQGTTTVASLTADQLTFGPSPSQTCTGDSGGPAFATLGGVEVIVGVTSSGDPQCDQMGRDMRVDAYASFITPWLRATAAGAAGPGDRCYYPENCAASAGSCSPALDDPTLSFCAPACSSSEGCPAGLQCLADGSGAKLCRHTPPSPGALGSTCEADGDCATGSCLAPATGGGTVCASTCFQDLSGFCMDGSRCLTAAGDAGVSACFTPQSAAAAAATASGGGCDIPAARSQGEQSGRGRRGASPAGAAFAIGAALACRRRRRRRPA
jgi:hypothetical protein